MKTKWSLMLRVRQLTKFLQRLSFKHLLAGSALRGIEKVTNESYWEFGSYVSTPHRRNVRLYLKIAFGLAMILTFELVILNTQYLYALFIYTSMLKACGKRLKKL